MDVTSGLVYPRKTQGKPQNRIRRLAGPIDRSPRSHRANATGATCRNPREKRGSRSDRRSADILAISSSEQRFRYIPLQRIPAISGVNEAAPWPICYVATPAWASRLVISPPCAAKSNRVISLVPYTPISSYVSSCVKKANICLSHIRNLCPLRRDPVPGVRADPYR
jgi:hypothetical protein